uniref:Sema domain-containing protein n=1 Tax=Acrobeloides nanus TaxID=290746 RepID=A0A914BWQ2_9BILA
MTYGICVVDADNALALLNTKRDASEKDGFYKSINASGLINGVLSTSTPVALLDFKFTDEEIIDHKVMPNFPDTKGQLYDVHFIATSSRIFKCITSSTINACFVLICEFKNIEQIEIWNRELLLIKTNSNVFSVPLYKCGLYNCFECFQVDDPFCGWDVTTATCIDISFANESTRASTKQGMYEKNPSKFCSSVMEFTQEEILHKIDQLKEGVANIRIEIDELRAYMESIYGQPPVDYLNKILEIDQLKEGVANIRTILEDLKKFLAKNNISENHTKIEDKELSILIEYLRNISVGIQNQNELSHNINELLAQLAAQNNNNNFYFYIILAIIFAVTRIFVNLISMVLKWVYKNCKYKYCKPTTTPNNETLEDVIVKKHNKHSKSHGNDHKDKNVDKNEPDDDNDDTKSKELEKLIEKNEGNKKSSANGRYVDDPTEGNDKVKKRKK